MLAGANCLLLVNSKCMYCHQKVTESNLTKIFFIILSICSLIETNLLPAGGAGEKGSVVDGGDGLVHERIRLDESQSFVREIGGWLVGGGWSLASAAAWPARQQQSERERKKKSIRHKSGSTGRCKNTGSCLFLGGAGGKNRCLVWLPFFKRCLCRTITATAAKALLSKAEKNVLGKWQFLFKDESLTLVLGLAPLEQVSRLTHYSSAL